DSPYGVVAGFDQREFAVVAADVEPEKVTPLVEVDDLGLGLVETKTSGPQPLGQLLLDLFRVLTTAAKHQQIVGIADQHRSLRRSLDAAPTASEIPDPGRRFHPVKCDVQDQGTDHATLRRALLRRGEAALLHHPRPQPPADHLPSGERAELAENEVVIDVVERSLEVGVENPLPSRVLALDDLVDGLDRVMTSPARPKPVILGLEAGLPFGLQCVTHASLLSAIQNHRDAERTQLPIRLRDEHPSHRVGGERNAIPSRGTVIGGSAKSTTMTSSVGCGSWLTPSEHVVALPLRYRVLNYRSPSVLEQLSI